MFSLNKDKVYLLIKKDFSVDMELWIPWGNNCKYRHLGKTIGSDVWYEYHEATFSTLQFDLHHNFVGLNQHSHRMCLYEFDNQEEANKFLLTEKLSR